MVKVLTELVSVASDIDITIITTNKHLNDAMQVFRDSALHVNEKDLNT